MALVKLCQTYYEGQARPIYLLQGNAVRDGEDAPVKGKDHAKVSVAAATTQDGDTIFVNVNGWRNRAADVAAIRKMDSVLAIGVLKKREYNGNFYYDLDADFISVSGRSGGSRSASGGSYGSPALPDSDGFAELPDDDGELPF